MAREKQAVIEKRKMDMLVYVLEQANLRESDVAVLSRRQLRSDNELTEGQVRLVLKKLEKEGLLEVRHRWHPNGGSAENAYYVTRKGLNSLIGCQSADKLPHGKDIGERLR